MALPEHIKDEDLIALRRAVQRMLGLGFRLLVVEVATPPQRDQFLSWLALQVKEYSGTLLKLDLESCPGKNLWVELKERLGQPPPRALIALWGMEATEYTHKRDGFGQMLNVQRDILVRDFPVMWVLMVHPGLRAQLLEVAPDFFDYALRWVQVEAPLPVVASETFRPLIPGTFPPLPLGAWVHPDRSLLEQTWAALGQWDHPQVLDGLARLRLRSLPAVWEPLLLLMEALMHAAQGHADALSLFQGAVDQMADPALQGVARIGWVDHLLRLGQSTQAQLELAKVSEPVGSDWWAQAEIRRARLEVQAGDTTAGEQRLRRVRSALSPETWSWAEVGDVLAHRLLARGEVKEAAHIWKEELLPVYKQLGDVRSVAITQGNIADVLVHQGEIAEGLRVLRKEVLPTFERLGDVRSRAACLGKIADVLVSQGEITEGLQILRKEVLPAFEHLRDVRSRAVCLGKIADVLVSQGEIAEGLRIRREEVLPVYERLGDVRFRAVCLGKIADVLIGQGEIVEGVRIQRKEVLPVFKQLGDIREAAVANSNIAYTLSLLKRYDEAWRILNNEVMPDLKKLGDPTLMVRVQRLLGSIYFHRHREGDRRKAKRILKEALLQAEQLGMVGEIQQINDLLTQLKK